ncbi:hypothetical protein GCM10010528_23260 [Gordonia defluvii]|uniref:Uncharacterized protein n=1 Tax=Gordonia defluvii TaxID=283718 RepID=A0ABP6LH99_9ACTN
MSDAYEYVDEDGNPLTPEEIAALGDDVEVVEEVETVDVPAPAVSADTPQEAAPALTGRSKMLLAGGAIAAVLVIGGGVAFALQGIGSQNTVDDVKAGASSKVAAASASVEEKKAETVAIDTCKTGVSSATSLGGTLSDAMADGGAAPKLRLDVIASTALPGAFTAARTDADGVAGEISMLQLTKDGWAVYVAIPLTKAEKKAGDRPAYHKADVSVSDDAVKVTGDRPWAGGDVAGAGSCEPAKAGAYAVSGKVPADAAGLVDGAASVDAIQGIAGQADRAVAVMGNSVALVKLVEAPAEGGDASPSSSSSAVPSK